MRTFIALLISYLDKKTPSYWNKSAADAASYAIQFPDDSGKAGCGAVVAGIGDLFPPLLVDGSLHVSVDTLSEVRGWYLLRSNASEPATQRATTAAHCVHYGIIHDGLESFIHYFIALDALFGERHKVEKNIRTGITKIFPSKTDWGDRADKLFELRNDLIHGGISSIKRWDGLEHYQRCFKSHPIQDIQNAAMTALRDYFSKQMFEKLFGPESY